MRKKIILIPTLFCFFMLSMISCSSSDGQSTSTTSISNTLKNGTWRVTSYLNSGTDETTNFTGYNFTFGSPSSLIASNGTNLYHGDWSVNKDEFDLFYLHIGYTDINTPANFAELDEDWHVISYSSVTISLEKLSLVGSATTRLVFTKS